MEYERPDWARELDAMDPDNLMYPPFPYSVGEQLWWLTPPGPPDGWVFEPDVAYATHGRPLVLNLYRPMEPSPPRPGVLFLHGGGWIGGHRLMNVRHAAMMAEAGMVGATVEYRFSGEAPWPAALEDVKAAIRWMKSRPDVDPDRIGVAGYSAGGHLAAMASVTPGLFEEARTEVQAVVMLYPALDLACEEGDPHLHELRDAFLAGTDPAEASPITYVNPHCPPTLTLTGSEDHLTVEPMIRPYHEKLDELGVTNELVVYEGAGHGFDQFAEYRDEVLDRTRDWFVKHL